MKKKNPLYTIGYESSDIQDFVAFLKKNKISLVADVRKNPLSRKRGFSKNKLAQALGEKDIQYMHFKSLGVPTEWRKQAKAKLITRKKMFSDYDKKILNREMESLQLLQKLRQDEKLALLCYEADASDCHRSFVANKLLKSAKPKFEIIDLRMPVRKGW